MTSCSETDEYLKCHHRTFIQQLMGTETETHIGALEKTPKVQVKSGRSETISKGVNILMGTPTEIAYLS